MQSREQGDLFPARLDDYVDQDHPIRALDAYVEQLDLRRLGYCHIQANEVDRGQPAYPPRALLKLYLYGYLNRLQSSRRLAGECRRNLEAMWLVQGLRPCYKTISDFRSVNRKAIRATHQEFILFCNALSLFGGACIAVDGSFFKGSASGKSFKTVVKLKKILKELDGHIAQWEQAFDRQDEIETSQGGTEADPQLAQKLETWRIKKSETEQALETLQAQGKTQESRTDADARLLNKGTQKVAGYNVQIAVDELHHLIVADAVTSDPNDLQQLHPMTVQAKAVLRVETLEVLADGGYYSAAQLALCAQDGLTAYVPEPTRPAKGNRYASAAFTYDEPADSYRCPAEHLLTPRGVPRQQNGQRLQRYASSETACRSCSLRDHCISSKSSCRELWRSEHEALLEAHRARMQANPDKMRLRSCLVEHPFGTLKSRAGWSHFVLRGRDKVSAEWSLMILSYNFTRVLNILGIEKFLEVVQRYSLFSAWKCLCRRFSMNTFTASERNPGYATIVVFGGERYEP
jgi:transposase